MITTVNLRYDLWGDRRLSWWLRHLVITVQDKAILHEKFKFPDIVLVIITVISWAE